MTMPMVLLPGWGVNSQIWNPLRQRLPVSLEIHQLDLPGYGNDIQYAGDYSLDRVTERVLAAAPQRAFWIAWSLGATIAMNAALNAPNRFVGLQLISPTPKFMSGPEWNCGMATAPLQKLAELFDSNYEKGLKKFLLLQLNRQSNAREHLRLCLDEIQRLPSPSSTILRKSLELLMTTDLRDGVSQLQPPIQIIAGSDDQVIPAAASRWLADEIPDARFIELAAGHLPFLSDQEGYLQELSALIGIGIA